MVTIKIDLRYWRQRYWNYSICVQTFPADYATRGYSVEFSNQINYACQKVLGIKWRGSNCVALPCKSAENYIQTTKSKLQMLSIIHEDVITKKRFPRY